MSTKKSFTQLQWVHLLKHGKQMYHVSELMRLSQLSESALKRAIYRLSKNDLLIKLGKGWYANSFHRPALEYVSTFLYPPNYISLESALFMHGILDQAPHVVTCVTLNKTKTFMTAIGEIVYYHIKPDLFFDYVVQDQLPIATPEKAALDYIYLQRQHGLPPVLNEWNWELLDRERLQALAIHFPRSVRKQIEEFA